MLGFVLLVFWFFFLLTLCLFFYLSLFSRQVGCKDHTGKKIEDAKPCPNEIACNLIVDSTGGPMCGSFPGQWGSVEGAVEGQGASSVAPAGAEAAAA